VPLPRELVGEAAQQVRNHQPGFRGRRCSPPLLPSERIGRPSLLAQHTEVPPRTASVVYESS
jgi:hypothetical protein